MRRYYHTTLEEAVREDSLLSPEPLGDPRGEPTR